MIDYSTRTRFKAVGKRLGFACKSLVMNFDLE